MTYYTRNHPFTEQAIDLEEAEFSRMHIIRGPRDIDGGRVPVFVAAYLRDQFAQGSAGQP